MKSNIKLIQENEDFVVFSKPAGLVVHADGRTTEETVVDWLLEKHPTIDGVGEQMFLKIADQEVEIKRPGIVHRLDRDTSGVMLAALNQEGFAELKNKFQGREIEKTYLAFVYGQPKADKGEVDAAIGRSPKDFRRWSAQRGARGNLRESITEWFVISRFEDEKGEPFSLIAFKPKTGRTHQIRVHAKYMHHPIVSDPLYAGKRKPALGFDRQALHANFIEFEWRGDKKLFSADLPEDFKKVVEKYQLDLSTLEKIG